MEKIGDNYSYSGERDLDDKYSLTGSSLAPYIGTPLEGDIKVALEEAGVTPRDHDRSEEYLWYCGYPVTTPKDGEVESPVAQVFRDGLASEELEAEAVDDAIVEASRLVGSQIQYVGASLSMHVLKIVRSDSHEAVGFMVHLDTIKDELTNRHRYGHYMILPPTSI